MTSRPLKLAILGGGVVVALVLGGGAAYASTQTPASIAPSTTGVAHATQLTNTTSGAGQSRTNGPDKPGSGTEKPESGTGTEASSPNDGPGGHADPDGVNVDHQFTGNE